ncbi:fungal-specific transcription factor domain-containing protein [Halenospora varia]|nr:fungal-specific transcription factor domain-containing protein [Halenospora varia]
MFTSFVGAPPRSLRSESGGSSTSSPSSPTMPVRPKRSQVARACDWCRVHRIKCDNNYPCMNCQNRGGQCSNRGTNEVRTLPHAMREIERLRMRVKELEGQIKEKDTQNEQMVVKKSPATTLPSPPPSSAASPQTNIDPLGDHGSHKRYWEGIQTSTALVNQTQYHGPSSMFYFMGRMSLYLGEALQQPHSERQMQPNSASRHFADPTNPRKINHEDTLMHAAQMPTNENYLTGTQENYFLNLFWQSYHCTLQVIDEAEFREHYNSLWPGNGKPRKMSALVDIVLAISMQYGIAFVPRGDAAERRKASVEIDSNDASIAGRWFYRRCQTLLACELESPSITTLQCHIFSVIYLCNGSFQNMAQLFLSLAVRTAQILGLHLEPPEDMPQTQRELRKRLWWTLYAVEAKTCMKLGRPWSTQISEVTCTLPADDRDLALQASSSFASFGDSISWLHYNTLNIKLVLAARAVYVAFFDKCADILGANSGRTLYNDPQGLESSADFLLTSMKCLQTWLRSVPDALKTQRKNGGEPFSTDRSTLDIETFAPAWLQRQRLLLELLYHNLSMNLYRPFINFSANTSSSTPLAEQNATSCVNHAMALTHIMNQMLNENDLLSGWNEAYQWQWNASITMVGFVLAYPMTPTTPPARNAINSAIEVFENYGNNFAMAISAAEVTRDLASKADFLIDRFRNSLTASSTPSMPAFSTSEANDINMQVYTTAPNNNTIMNNMAFTTLENDENATMVQTALESMGMAFTVDSFDGFGPLYPGGNQMSDTWNFQFDQTD